MADTTFRPGDFEHVIVRKWLEKLGGDWQPGDNLVVLLRKILALTPGSEAFRFGDSIGELLRKILVNSGGEWKPADTHNNLWRKILEQQTPGSAQDEFQPGDLDSAFERKILNRA